MGKDRLDQRSLMLRMLKHVRESEETTGPDEIDASWTEVMSRAFSEQRRRFRRRLVWTAVASVAAVAVVAGAYFMTRQEPVLQMTPVDYAIFAQTSPGNAEEITLMIPGSEDLLMKEREAEIVYDGQGTAEVRSHSSMLRGSQPEAGVCNQLVVPNGRRARLTLSDGTHMWVNSGTRVVYPASFLDKKREIFVDGEVYLEVARNEKSPFVVRTNNFSVEVHGTSFNVSAYGSQTVGSVVLVNGSVDVSNKTSGNVRLTPGELVEIRTKGIGTPRHVDVEPYICWKDNLLIYSDDSLENVFRKLSLYYGRTIIIAPEVASLRVSGKLDLKDNLEDVLRAVSFSTLVEYEFTDDAITVRKSEK